MPVKELFLVVEARPPGEVRADFEVFTEAVAIYIRGVNAFWWIGVVGAACGMNMMGSPDHQLRFAGSTQRLRRNATVCGLPCMVTLQSLRQILRSACIEECILSRRQFQRLAVGAIDLIVEEEIGGKPLSSRGVDPALLIATINMAGVGSPSLSITRNFRGAEGVLREDVRFAAKSEVLRSRPDRRGASSRCPVSR